MVKKASLLWQPASVSSEKVIEKAKSALHLEPIKVHHRFLVNEKWPFLNIFVFDLYHETYRSASGHLPEDLPVLVVEYGRKGTAVSVAGIVRRHEVNIGVARHHNLNGWNCEPPFFADYTLPTPVSYLDPRDSSLLASSPATGRNGEG